MKTAHISHSFASAAIASLLALTVSMGGAVVASAQTVSDVTMPALYNAQGMEVNISSTAPLAAGYYYLAPGAQADTQVYYYGDGTFVNETTGLYGGSVSDPDGTVGVTLVYGTRAGTTAPGAPNTGAGGDASATWMTLAVTGLIAVAGASFLAINKHSASTAF